MGVVKICYKNICIDSGVQNNKLVVDAQTETSWYEPIYFVDRNPNLTGINNASESSPIWVRFSFAEKVPAYGIFLINHSLDSGNNMWFEGDNSSNFSSTDFSVNMTSGVTAGGAAFYVSNTALTPANGNYYLRIKIASADFGQPLEIGEIFILGAAPYSFAMDVREDYEHAPEPKFRGAAMPSGYIYETEQYSNKSYLLKVSHMTDAQRIILEDAIKHIYVMMDFTSAGYGSAVYGIIDQTSSFKRSRTSVGTYWSVGLRFYEMIYDQVTTRSAPGE